jgi:ribosome-binding factor A
MIYDFIALIYMERLQNNHNVTVPNALVFVKCLGTPCASANALNALTFKRLALRLALRQNLRLYTLPCLD